MPPDFYCSNSAVADCARFIARTRAAQVAQFDKLTAGKIDSVAISRAGKNTISCKVQKSAFGCRPLLKKSARP